MIHQLAFSSSGIVGRTVAGSGASWTAGGLLMTATDSGSESAPATGMVRVWEAASGTPRTVLTDVTRRSYDLSFSADGRRLAWIRRAPGAVDGVAGTVQAADVATG